MDAWLEVAATVMQVAPLAEPLGGIISKLLQLADTASRNKEECEELAHHARMILTLHHHLLQHSPLVEWLAGTLQEALQLVESWQKKSMFTRFWKADEEARKFQRVRRKITDHIAILTYIGTIDTSRRLKEFRRFLHDTANGNRLLQDQQQQQLHRHVRHPQEHVVRSGANNGERRLVTVVYKYVVVDKGTLDHHLQRAPPSSYSPVAACWKKRLQVLLGAARGIPSSGVHGNISSSNIYLDHHGASVTCPLKVRRTGEGSRRNDGYVAPEVRLTPATDVYSFGVVILEVLTGRRSVVTVHAAAGRDGKRRKAVQIPLVSYVQRFVMAGEMWKLLDARPAPEPTTRQLEALMKVARLAFRCVQPEWAKRPTMSGVKTKLEEALQLLHAQR